RVKGYVSRGQGQFIVLPSFWVLALGWGGATIGGLMQGLTEGTKDAKSAGGGGANIIMSQMKK
ncbi:hypothetical protein A584_19026, partial [Pseudomonas syringae pv. theae ICMP 3923]